MTPLETIIREMIAQDGPMPLDRYMALCLAHPQHGYYMTRDPLGRGGDFTTSPEISQVFGELIGIWCAQVWQLQGELQAFAWVELGPGRGTLLLDAWRATAKVRGFHEAASIHLVETSPALRQKQTAILQNVPNVSWHDTVETLPNTPMIVIANEFFDAIPVRQFEHRGDDLFERCVAIESDALAIALIPTGQKHPSQSDSIYETSPARTAIAKSLGQKIAGQGGAALIFDYGHRKSAKGDTVQAMKDHGFCSIFDTPGAADLTAHVDFEQLMKAFASVGAATYPLLTQGEFLRAMGVDMRTQSLARGLDGAARDNLVSATHRLVDEAGMGQLFKVAAITQPGLAPPYPFGDV